MATQKQILKEVYEAMFVIVGAYGVSLASKKIPKTDLGAPDKPVDMVKLAAAVGVSAAIVKVLQEKKYLPENPWKE